jgi:phosphoglycerate dehydrogenase-like enzyme
MEARIALLQPVSDEMRAIIAELLPPGFTAEVVRDRTPEDAKRVLRDADYALWWDVPVTAEIIAAAPRVKLFHKWGVGVDNIDLEACRARGIRIARTTGSNATPVAEFAVGLMIALGRGIVMAHNTTVAGGWAKNEVWARSILVSGKTIGIIGLGEIGRGVARRLAGFDGVVLYHNRNRLPEAEERTLGVAYRALPELLAESDIVSLHCPLTPQTRGLLDAAAFAQMKRGALLVNVARGGVVVEAALVEALRSGHLAGAAVDVFDQEPPPPEHPLLHLPNVIATPHCASTARENSRRSVQHWLGNMLRVARGEPIPERDVVL